MLGWLGALGSAGIVFLMGASGIATGGLTWAIGGMMVAKMAAGATVGGFLGHIGDKVADNMGSELKKQDKQLEKELQNAKTDGEKAKAAQKALEHQTSLLNTLSNQVAKNNSEMENLQKIVKGEIKLPDGKTMEEIKAQYAKLDQENASLFDQIKKSQITSNLLQEIISNPSRLNWPTLTFKNVGLGIGLILIGLFLIKLIIKTIRKLTDI